MRSKSPALESITEPLRQQIRKRARLLNYLAWPLTFLSSAFALWLITRVFGTTVSLDNPQSLLGTAVMMTGVLMLARAAYHLVETSHIQNDPLMMQAPRAIEHVSSAASRSSTRQEVADALNKEVEALFHPQVTEIALYDQRAHSYRVGENSALPADNPLAAWLVKQPLNVPIPLADAELPPEADAARNDLLARGIALLVPFGAQGWLALGAPEAQATYDAAQQSLLQYLTRPAAIGLERATIIESQHKRATELNSLYWIAQAVNFTMDLDDVFELIYTQLKRVMPLPNFYIALRDPDRNILCFNFFVDGEHRLESGYCWSVDEGLTSIVLRNSMTLRTNNYIAECRKRGIEPSGPKPEQRAWMGVPLMAGDQSIGVMVAATTQHDVIFSEEDETFFVTIAAYTASILERHVLEERLEARARQLSTLNEIGNLLASSLDLQEVLDLVVRNAATLLASDAGSLLLLDEDSGDLVFRISSGGAGEQLVGMRVPAGKGIAGAAFSENRPVITQDTHKDHRWYSGLDKKSEFNTESILAVPLNARGRTIGVLEVLNRKDGRPFNDEDTELLLSFGAQAAIAIENAQLFTMTDQALQARVEELTRLQHIDRQLNATLDYAEVMGQTLEWAVRITGATIGIIAALQEEEDGTRGLRFLAHKGYPEEMFQRYAEMELWPLEDGLMGTIVREGTTSLVKNVRENAQYKEVVPGMEAQLTVPIKREERVIGVIALESAQAESFSEENVAFIVRLADHAAIAIDNARLFQQLQRANAAKTEFVSFVSHELKQPMTSMKGYTDLLMKGIGGELNEQQKGFVHVIRSNVGRMDRLVQDLLDVSRIESGRLRLEMGQVVPAEIISEAVQAFKQEIENKAQELVVDIPPDLPTARGDRGRLIQVLTNLVSNANKYTPEGGKVTVGAELHVKDDVDYVRWSVKDTGIGMTEEDLEKLFTKYFRASNSAVRSVQGTGLGLVITRSIVEMHNGFVDVQSTYQKGSEFSFAVPIQAAA